MKSGLIEAGTVINFGGHEVILADNTRVLCNEEDFDRPEIAFIVPKAVEKVGE